ncbi:D-alanine--poly(phosphoribitol) ligase subunit 2 [Clostridium saccharobutylicum]|uniref:D-alanyl carrier protein n=2 Tax=Clostridium saccharobutylicum TaxID=169679 RepID=U5N0G5_CLOSA|nr:D-alanine--poly(phosphoribitol) ligase subunit 2 [Clostridium saccharobutylicum]AGX45282.1 D-alanine--poly(phosphoribitol) ligase, subunit 2 [Clostridium saccharobutylicum DSM 13864]AQR92557.1 D-alanine--poly(phosphoribitol) ligase subunit 2 [Clostridium saccharobutylicum]AQS02459.1 D-alanine--poly(phosphoribitol) ligase subunit 2 [Clostridium saccharobutylicum]AQS12062.1 D-alanine--poly(phosphoribitol) ligase subunit 2 [Clostridium saccharobutylicum]AQS16442.1 D-alanine--poly(phosphoribito
MEEKVVKILVDVIGNDDIEEERDENLFEAGLLDSLGIIEVLLKIEEVFGLKLQPTDLERKDMATVNNLVAFLKTKL